MVSALSRLELARLEHPAATDKALMRCIASEVLDELGINEPPINVEMVASMLDIAIVVPDTALSAAGCLLCGHDGRFEIRVRAGDPRPRQRFTICHECSHTFFPGFATATQYRCSPSSRPTQRRADVETLCDVAAGELLFPRRLFVPDVRRSSFGLDGLEELADRYQGSLEATGHKLVAAWPEPAALLIFTVRNKPSEKGMNAPPRLRLDRAHTEGGWPYFLPHKSATAGDVFDRAGQGEIVSETTMITGITGNTAEPISAEVHAQLCPVTIDGALQPRVIALARRVGR